MKTEGTKKEKKRVSFLMPYIDFCFMLIIIFVGMLSIAYFEPLGTADLQSEKEEKIDRLEGRHDVRPTGIQYKRSGVGLEESGAGEVHPLINPGAAQPGGTGADKKRTPEGAARSDISKEELEKLKKELEEKNKKLREMEEQLGEKGKGRGDHLFIDLGE
ncbi:MAG: hypothetical protein AB1546_09850 [bacterium]